MPAVRCSNAAIFRTEATDKSTCIRPSSASGQSQPTCRAPGRARTQIVRWKSDGTATLTTPDGALDVVLRLERTEVGTVAIVVDGSWRRPTWVYLAAIELTLPADGVTLFGRDLEPMAAPPLAVL